MELIEIRELDGPNLFLLQPAIKLELRPAERDLTQDALAALLGRLGRFGNSDEGQRAGLAAFGDLLVDAALALHRYADADQPEVRWAEIETPGHVALVFGWERRQFGRAVAEAVATLALGEDLDLDEFGARLRDLNSGEPAPDDVPQVVWDAERTVPIVGITGTNGKTTTTRLVAHVLRNTGRKVGWSSSTGVYIEGEQVVKGDYTGPQGARRVLDEPGLDVAVLETARGGILLRGLAYQSNDVSIFTNVSGDHLDLHGIHTVEGLAKVKATVIRVTRPDGYAVLNADDPLVRAWASTVHASVFLISRRDDNLSVMNHVATGGHALFVRDGKIVFAHGDRETEIATVVDVPITFGGRAGHMLENSLCAAAACLGLGLSPEEVGAGLTSFHNTADQNTGRLNVYDVDGATVIVDYAHNEVGLSQLLRFGATFRREGGRIVSVVGTAGDRPDRSLRELGRVAGQDSDRVILKKTTKYLRGREPDEMEPHYIAGIQDVGDTPWSIEAGEFEAVTAALADLNAGDVLAIMCLEEQERIHRRLTEVGRPVT